MGYGVDRTFSAQQWRVVVYSACGVLLAGIGLGVLIGRLTAPVPEPPPASASILPDVLPSVASTPASPSAPSDDDADEPAPAAAVPAPAVPAPAPAPAVKAAPAPAVQKSSPQAERAAAKPQRPTPPKPVEAKAKRAEPEPPADGARWVVQLGAFQSSDHANLLVNTLAAHGQQAHVSFSQNAAGQGWFYVQTPPYRSAAAAKSAAQTLGAREHLPTYVVKLPDAG